MENKTNNVGDGYFNLTEEHLKLLQNCYTSWWNCEFGAVCIDPKRPYGNSDVLSDIAEILGIKGHYNEEEYATEYTESEIEYMNKLHGELETALMICLQLQTFEVGMYKCKRFYHWEKC